MIRFLLVGLVLAFCNISSAQELKTEKPKETATTLIDQSQVAVALKKDGRRVGIILVSLDSKELQFKMNQNETKSRTSSAKTGDIKAVLLKSGKTYAINPKTTAFEPYDTATDTFNATKDDANSEKSVNAKEVGANKGAKPKAEAEKVIAEGVGTTGDEALKDAFRNAVRQVVGSVVDAETMLKNDDVISDKVLTYSDGFIKQYDEISKNQDKGLFRVKISASVERRNVVAKLRASNIIVTVVDTKKIVEDLKNEKAKELTQQEAQKNAIVLVARSLEGFPENVVQAEVVNGIKRGDRTVKGVEIDVEVQLSINQKAYERLVERLGQILEQTSTDSKEGSVKAEAHDETYRFERRLLPAGVLSVVYHHTKNGNRTEWKIYSFSPIASILDTIYSRTVTVKLSMLDNDGKLVAIDRFKPSDVFPVNSPRPYLYRVSGVTARTPLGGPDRERYVISPFFFASGPQYKLRANSPNSPQLLRTP